MKTDLNRECLRLALPEVVGASLYCCWIDRNVGDIDLEDSLAQRDPGAALFTEHPWSRGGMQLPQGGEVLLE